LGCSFVLFLAAPPAAANEQTSKRFVSLPLFLSHSSRTHTQTPTKTVWKLANDVDVLEVEEQVRGYAAEEAEKGRQRQQQLGQGGGGALAFRGGYAPGAAAAGTAAAAGGSLPVPLAAVPLEADGRIAVPEARRRPTQAQAAAAARAAGWAPAIPRLRALQDALRGVFAF
jgi:hypothetical protein